MAQDHRDDYDAGPNYPLIGCLGLFAILVLLGVSSLLGNVLPVPYNWVATALIVVLAVILGRVKKPKIRADSEFLRSSEIEGPKPKRQPKPKSNAKEGR